MFNYNNDAYLFKNYRTSNPEVVLYVYDGNVYSPKDKYIARCTDNDEANKILTEAGYTHIPRNDDTKQYNP